MPLMKSLKSYVVLTAAGLRAGVAASNFASLSTAAMAKEA
jgi:hypothetical protein